MLIDYLYNFLKEEQLPISYQHNIIKKVYNLDLASFMQQQDSLDINKLINFCNEYKITRQPIAYLCGFEYFCGLEFIVDKHVLIPRVESEELVQLTYQYIINHFSKGSTIKLLDLCCGSGCLGISLYKMLENDYQIQLISSDIYNDALSICRANFNKHCVDGKIIESDLLTNIDLNNVNVIITNPPYVPNTRKLDKLVMQEPHIALFSGVDGLDCYKEIFKQLTKYGFAGHLFGEIDPTQNESILSLATNIQVINDLSNVARFIEVDYENK